MKATINGIQVEGTPEEIAQFQQLQAYKSTKPYWSINPYITQPTTADWTYRPGLVQYISQL